MLVNTLPKLNEGEEICPKCKGDGSLSAGVFTNKVCPKCQGKGKLDWIEKIVGVKPPSKINGTGCIGIGMSAPSTMLHITDHSTNSKNIIKNQHLRRNNSDNGVISELVFYPTTESKDKNKKN